MKYTVHKRLLGGTVVDFMCETCAEPLKAPLEDAGSPQTCPRCGASFITPGEQELEAQNRTEQGRREREAAIKHNKIMEIENKERQKRDEKELKERQQRQEAAEKVARQENGRKELIYKVKMQMRTKLEAGEKVFLYESVYQAVDSVLMEESLGVFSLDKVREMGLEGWEAVGVIPRTVGMVSKNTSIGSTMGTTWGGGAGGNVVGVHVMLRKELRLTDLQDTPDDAIANYIERLRG